VLKLSAAVLPGFFARSRRFFFLVQQREQRRKAGSSSTTCLLFASKMSHESTPLLHRNSKAGDDASAALNHPTPLRTNKATFTPPPAILTSMVTVGVVLGIAAFVFDFFWYSRMRGMKPCPKADFPTAIVIHGVGGVFVTAAFANYFFALCRSGDPLCTACCACSCFAVQITIGLIVLVSGGIFTMIQHISSGCFVV
jgi:hypothetical protein